MNGARSILSLLIAITVVESSAAQERSVDAYRAAIDLPAEILDEYVGSYQSSDGAILTITHENGALGWHHSLFGSASLLATAIDRLFLLIQPVEILVTRDDADVVQCLDTLGTKARSHETCR